MEFYKEGQLKVVGKYDDGKKVGRWVEYYQFRRQRKKEIQYPKTAWEEEFEPFVLREWDDKGQTSLRLHQRSARLCGRGNRKLKPSMVENPGSPA